MDAQDRGCLCKRRYESKDEALAAIAAIASEKPHLDGLMHWYKCRWCKNWHITKYEREFNKPPSKRQLRRKQR